MRRLNDKEIFFEFIFSKESTLRIDRLKLGINDLVLEFFPNGISHREKLDLFEYCIRRALNLNLALNQDASGSDNLRVLSSLLFCYSTEGFWVHSCIEHRVNIRLFCDYDDDQTRVDLLNFINWRISKFHRHVKVVKDCLDNNADEIFRFRIYSTNDSRSSVNVFTRTFHTGDSLISFGELLTLPEKEISEIYLQHLLDLTNRGTGGDLSLISYLAELYPNIQRDNWSAAGFRDSLIKDILFTRKLPESSLRHIHSVLVNFYSSTVKGSSSPSIWGLLSELIFLLELRIFPISEFSKTLYRFSQRSGSGAGIYITSFLPKLSPTHGVYNMWPTRFGKFKIPRDLINLDQLGEFIQDQILKNMAINMFMLLTYFEFETLREAHPFFKDSPIKGIYEMLSENCVDLDIFNSYVTDILRLELDICNISVPLRLSRSLGGLSEGNLAFSKCDTDFLISEINKKFIPTVCSGISEKDLIYAMSISEDEIVNFEHFLWVINFSMSLGNERTFVPPIGDLFVNFVLSALNKSDNLDTNIMYVGSPS